MMSERENTTDKVMVHRETNQQVNVQRYLSSGVGERSWSCWVVSVLIASIASSIYPLL